MKEKYPKESPGNSFFHVLTFIMRHFSGYCLELDSVLLLEFLVFLPQGVNSINHLLDELNLRVAKTMLVGDVISVALILIR